MKLSDDDDDDDVVRDGESVRVPVFLVDTIRFEDDGPRFLRMADEAVRDTGAATRDADHRPGFRYATDAARAAVRAARDEMIRRAQKASRTPHRDAGQPDLGTRPEELMMRRHLFGAPGAPDPGDVHAVELRGEQAQRERDRAWSRYRDDLANAWKTNPRAATAIERRGERTSRYRLGREAS